MKWRSVIAAGLVGGWALAACDPILGLDKFTIAGDQVDSGIRDAARAAQPEGSSPGVPEASSSEASSSEASSSAPAEASTGAGDAIGDGSSVGDDDAAAPDSCIAMDGACYACAPTTAAQFLNACTSAACVPFDNTRLTRLLPDGALPPLPSADGGSE